MSDQPFYASPDGGLSDELRSQLPRIVWTTDRDLRLTSLSGTELARVGTRLEQAVGASLHEFFEMPAEDGLLVASHRRALAGETILADFDWAGRLCRATVAPLRNNQGEVIGCIGVAFDAPKVLKEESWRSEGRYRSIVEAHPDLVARFTPDTVLTYVNEAYCRYFGATREALLGKSFLSLVAEPYRDVTQERLQQITAEQPVIENEELVELPSGEVRWQQWINRGIFDEQGRIVEVQSTGRDVTERKQAQEALERERHTLRHMLRASDHERQLIAYEIHDGLAQQLAAAIMQLQTYEHLRGQSLEDAKTAYDAGTQMLRQAHAEARRLISGVRPPILDESGITAAIAHLVYDQRETSGIPVEFVGRVSFDRLPKVLENTLYRIAQEALTNAAKHSRSENVRVSLIQEGGRVRLEIQDWGIGFDPAAVPSGRFGLEGIRERVRLLGGSATIDSHPGKGTLVSAVLPLVVEDSDEE